MVKVCYLDQQRGQPWLGRGGGGGKIGWDNEIAPAAKCSLAIQRHRNAATTVTRLKVGTPEVKAAEPLGFELHVLSLEPPLDLGAGQRFAEQVTCGHWHCDTFSGGKGGLGLERDFEGVGLKVLHLES